MKEKIKYAERFKTYEAKGRRVCEREDGTFYQECIKIEDAKGDQGVTKEQLLYSSLMEDFDEFAIEKKSNFLQIVLVALGIMLILIVGIIIWKKRN